MMEEERGSNNNVTNEKLVCCKCGKDEIEFCAFGWFDSRTNKLIEIYDNDRDEYDILYCRNCRGWIGDLTLSSDFNPSEAMLIEIDSIEKNCHVHHYTVFSLKREQIKHNDQGEMVCNSCGGNNLRYSVYAWFDINSEEFVEFAEDPNRLSYSGVLCDDCGEMYPIDFTTFQNQQIPS